MVSEPNAVVRLTRLRAELERDVSAMEARASEVDDLLRRWSADGNLGRAEIIVMAVNLHGWYTALETALERIARLLDQSVPGGSTWHVDLVEQMQLDVAGVRPAALPGDSRPKLDELRKFRHFFRNAYVFDLDPDLVRRRAIELSSLHGPISASLGRAQAHIIATLAEMAR